MMMINGAYLFNDDILKITNNYDCDTITELFTTYGKLDSKIITDNYIFRIIATSNNELRTLLDFFKKFNLTGNQIIKLKTRNISFDDLEIIFKDYNECNFIRMDKLVLDVSCDISDDLVYISEFNKMRTIINNVKKTIPDDSSNLEIITHVYNWLKKRQYKHDYNNPMYSKTYSTALITEYIVCVGFSKVFNNVLSEFGIHASEYQYFFKGDDNIENGHDISIVKVIDEKYGVNGLYFFDLTKDCYKPHNNNDYKYSGFMMTYDEVSKSTITKDMFNKMLLYDIKDLQDTIDILKIEVDKLKPSDNRILNADDFSEEIINLFCNLLKTDYNLFPRENTVDMTFLNIPEGMMYFINKYIVFLKQSFGNKMDQSTFIDLLMNTIKDRDIGYYLISAVDYYSDSDNDNLNKQFQYIKNNFNNN